MKKRNPVLVVVFTIISFGIYGLVWYCSTQNQIKRISNQGFGGGVHFLLSIVTFGIYPLYWYMVVDSRLIKMGASKPSLWWVYLILILTGFGTIIIPALIQSKANQTTQAA